MLHFYMVAYLCIRNDYNGQIKYGSVAVWAQNGQEALGYGYEYVYEHFPYPEWVNHTCNASQLDDEVILLAAERLNKQKGI